MTWVNLAKWAIVLLFAFGMGVALIPSVAVLFSRDLPRGVRGVIGRILWTEGAIAYGRVVKFWDATGYHLKRPVEDGDGWRVEHDGETYHINSDESWGQLGQRPFGIAWRKDDSTLEWATPDPEDLPVADGGERATKVVQRGAREAVLERTPGDAIDILYSRFATRIGTSGDVSVIDHTKEHTMREHGGDDTSQTAYLLAIGVCLMLGIVTVVIV